MFRSLFPVRSGLSETGGQTQAHRRPEDVAGVVAFLLSADAAHVNGAAWTVDAGSTVA